jgi:2-isopropylmalate synthase/UPF0716 protein FxsA
MYFILYFFLEVIISVDIAGRIGGLATFFEIILSAGVGFFLLTNFRYTLAKSMTPLMNGEISFEDFQKMSLFTLIGAMLLIIPGFFSDILGVLLQFTFFGTFFAKKILGLKHRKKTNNRREDEVIDVEVIDTDIIK